jgi:hypothetical protein
MDGNLLDLRSGPQGADCVLGIDERAFSRIFTVTSTGRFDRS